MKYELSTTLIQNIYKYLEQKPYVEVCNLINALAVEISQNNKKLDNSQESSCTNNNIVENK